MILSSHPFSLGGIIRASQDSTGFKPERKNIQLHQRWQEAVNCIAVFRLRQQRIKSLCTSDILIGSRNCIIIMSYAGLRVKQKFKREIKNLFIYKTDTEFPPLTRQGSLLDKWHRPHWRAEARGPTAGFYSISETLYLCAKMSQ